MSDDAPTSWWDHLRRDNGPEEMRVATALATRLVAMAEQDPLHPLVVAARSAVELIDARAAEHRALREVALDVRSHPSWPEAIREHVPHETIMRRRYPPHGDPAQWAAGEAA